MALTDSDKKILQEIVTEEGKCLNSKRCQVCPFRAMCLQEFLNTEPPSQAQRFSMALSVLTHHLLVDDDMTSDEVQAEYRWSKK